jgi:hypothetical protein
MAVIESGMFSGFQLEAILIRPNDGESVKTSFVDPPFRLSTYVLTMSKSKTLGIKPYGGQVPPMKIDGFRALCK